VTASTLKSFNSRWAGVPSAINDLDKAVAQLVYIASSSEKSYIESAPTKEEKIKRYLEFWKKKNPNPNEEDNRVFDEYYRRINFANENFTYFMEGWRSDRGMVYITLGPPNNIDRHPFDYDAKPYEIWEYYDMNQQFIFVDETGFGDYRLTTPMYGDMYRYRY
jgi:GWxTD domain-containing protein